MIHAVSLPWHQLPSSLRASAYPSVLPLSVAQGPPLAPWAPCRPIHCLRQPPSYPLNTTPRILNTCTDRCHTRQHYKMKTVRAWERIEHYHNSLQTQSPAEHTIVAVKGAENTLFQVECGGQRTFRHLHIQARYISASSGPTTEGGDRGPEL